MNEGFLYKPHEFPVSGDGDFLVQNLRWHSWGPKTAVATGQAVEQGRARACSGAARSAAFTPATARTVVGDWFQRIKEPGGNHCFVPDGDPHPAVCMVESWRCTTRHTVDGHTYPVTCTAGRRRVQFTNEV
jgi:hypothetical protein